MELIQKVSRPDRKAVFAMLADLDRKYPGGLAWLDGRLDDVEAGRAGLWQVLIRRQLAAVAIETLKGRQRLKLSTFFVSPRHRGHGLGTRLLDEMCRAWRRDGVDEVVVTVDQWDMSTQDFFVRNAFRHIPDAAAVVGPERIDRVLLWTGDAVRAGRP